tara:strand:+ start:1099 stop:2094 length:996 start_codon:yes stop_codon:yes gene_type:complete
MQNLLAVDLRKCIKDDKPSFLSILSLCFYKSTNACNRDRREVIKLMIEHSAFNCLKCYVEKFDKIDIDFFIEKDDVDILLFALRNNLVRFDHSGHLRSSVMLDSPVANMNIAYYLKKAIVRDKANIVRYLLRGHLKLGEILDLPEDEVSSFDIVIEDTQIHKLYKRGKIDIAYMLAEAAIAYIYFEEREQAEKYELFNSLNRFIYENKDKITINKPNVPYKTADLKSSIFRAIKRNDLEKLQFFLREAKFIDVLDLLEISPEDLKPIEKGIEKLNIYKLEKNNQIEAAILIAEAGLNNLAVIKNRPYPLNQIYTKLNNFVKQHKEELDKVA